MYSWANKLKLVRSHPAKGIGYLKVPQKERDLTHEEVRHLLTVSTGDLHDMALLALGTGMRASEILGLTREAIDMKNRVVVLGDTKNGDRRVVPLPPQVLAMLAQRPAPLRELFPGWTLKKLVDHFRKVAKRANLPGVTFHTLRHTFASHAAMNGVDLHTLAKLLGHRTLGMVQRYAHLATAHLQAATERTAAAIFAEYVPQNVPHEGQKVA